MFKMHSILIAFTLSILGLLLSLTNYVIITQEKPAYIPAEYWIPEIYIKKKLYSKKLNKNKVIIISGSNSLFGICTEVFEEKAKKPLLNLAVHAGLPIEFLVEIVKQYAIPGDTIIMPLEYEYIFREESPSKWEIEQFSTWGREYLHVFSAFKRIEIFVKSTGDIAKRLRSIHKEIPVREEREIKKLQNKNIITKKSYTVDSSNLYGEFFMDEAPTEHIKEKQKKGIPYAIKNEPSEHFIKTLSNANSFFKKKNISLVITYPTSIKNALFNLDDTNILIDIKKLYGELSKNNISVMGNPHKYNLDTSYFYDSTYHLNAYGATLRTLFLVDDFEDHQNSIVAISRPEEVYISARKKEALRILNHYRETYTNMETPAP